MNSAYNGVVRVLRVGFAYGSISAAIPAAYLVAAIVLGVGYAMLVPPRQVPDEAYHFVRAYGVSEGHCLAGPTVPTPVTLQFDGRFDEHMEVRDLARTTALAEVRKLLQQPMNPSRTDPVYAKNVDVYSCIPYLPAAAAIAAVRAAGGSMLAALYAARLLSLLVATLVTWYALRLLPTGRPLMAAVALLPMTLQQAASPSADSLSNAVAFLLVAAIVRLALDETIVRIGPRMMAALGALLVALALTKLNIFLFLPAVAIPSTKFGGRARKLAAIGVGTLLAFGAFWLWLQIDSAAVARSTNARVTEGIDYGGNFAFVLHHPGLFAIAVRNSLTAWGHDYLAMFVGVLGLLNVRLPNWAWEGALGAVTLAAITGFDKRLPRRVALLFFAAAALSIVVVQIITFASETTIAYRETRIRDGSGLAFGIQGRYYIPYAFALLAPLGLLRVPRQALSLSGVALAVVVLTSIPAYYALYEAYWRSPIVNAARADELGLRRKRTWILDADRTLSLAEIPANVRIPAPVAGLVPSSRWAPHRPIATFDAGRWRIGVVPTSVCSQPIVWQRSFTFGSAADQPVFGDWWGTGTPTAGLFRDGTWSLRDPRRGEAVVRYRFGKKGDVAVVGDWNGDGRSKLGVFRRGLWYLDPAGSAQHGLTELPGATRLYIVGSSRAQPVVGDWTGDGRDKVGAFEGGRWTLDVNGDGDEETPSHSATGFIFGDPADAPLVGKWSC
jgi:uncharacterized membrane protein